MKTNNKYFKGVLAICCGLIVCGSFASCDKDDNDFEVKQDTGDNRELASAEIIYKVSLASQELAVDDVVVSYTDKEGQEHSMTMTDNEWTWKCDLTPADCPKNFVLKVKPTRKENLNLDKNAQYEVGVLSKIIVRVKNKAGRTICDCDGLGLSFTGFHQFTGEQLMNPWSSTVSGWFDDLTSTSKKTVEVFPSKTLAQSNKLKNAIVAWLILGDLHTCIVNKVCSYPDKDNYEESLNNLLRRIIKNSLITGLKDRGFWRSVQSKKKLFTKDEEMEKLLDLIKKEITESEDSKTSQQNAPDEEKQVYRFQQKKGKTGRKPKFEDLKEKTLEAFIVFSIGNQSKAETYTQKIVNLLTKCSTGEELAALAVALEHLNIIKSIDNGGVRLFWNMLHDKCNTIVGYETMNDSYKKLEAYNKKGKVPADCISGMKKIKEYVTIFQEMNNEHENDVQETSVKAN